jgi:hypothetical protein
MYHLNIPQPDIVNPGATGIYVDYLDGNKGHSTNIAKQEKRKTGTNIGTLMRTVSSAVLLWSPDHYVNFHSLSGELFLSSHTVCF